MVNIKGLDKAQVLKALYDNSHPQGLGFLQAGKTVTLEECAKLLEEHTYFDYLAGRVLKVDLSGDEFDPRLYDRDCGEGAAKRAVDSIRGETKGGEDVSEGADGENKEPSMEEKKEKVLKAVDKIMNILLELSPDEILTVSAFLQMILPGKPPMSVSMMAGRLFGGPSKFGWFR